MDTRKLILVVDVAACAPAEEIERKLAAPLKDNYSLVGTFSISIDGGCIRAVYKLRTQKAASDAGADFIMQNPTMSVERIRTALDAKGIKRSKDWVAGMKKDV